MLQLPEPLQIDVINRLAQSNDIADLLAVGSVCKNLYELTHSPEVLKVANIDHFKFRARYVRIGSTGRPFFERCLSAGNPTALLMEGIRVAFREWDCDRGITILQRGLTTCPYNVLATGMCHVMNGRSDEGSDILETLRWWDDIVFASGLGRWIVRAVAAMRDRDPFWIDGGFIRKYRPPRYHGAECECDFDYSGWFACEHCYARSVSIRLRLLF